jgi:hypothetical protein
MEKPYDILRYDMIIVGETRKKPMFGNPKFHLDVFSDAVFLGNSKIETGNLNRWCHHRASGE